MDLLHSFGIAIWHKHTGSYSINETFVSPIVSDNTTTILTAMSSSSDRTMFFDVYIYIALV